MMFRFYVFLFIFSFSLNKALAVDSDDSIDESNKRKPIVKWQGELTPVEDGVKRRMTIDVGSGSIKCFIGDVCDQTMGIVYERNLDGKYEKKGEVYEHGRTFRERRSNNNHIMGRCEGPFSLKDHLGSHGGQFRPEFLEKIVEAFKEMQTKAQAQEVAEIRAIGTAALREARAEEREKFVRHIEGATGIHVVVIDQIDEGKIAFHAASRYGNEEGNVVVLDIGGGSAQATYLRQYGQVKIVDVVRYNIGSESFRKFVTEHVKEASGDTPNPLAFHDIVKSLRVIEGLLEDEKTSRDLIQAAVEENNGADPSVAVSSALTTADAGAVSILQERRIYGSRVYGMGGLFENLFNQVYTKNERSRTREMRKKDLYRFISDLQSKHDDEIGKWLENRPGHERVTDIIKRNILVNAILAVGFMERLRIDKMYVDDAFSGLGLLTYNKALREIKTTWVWERSRL